MHVLNFLGPSKLATAVRAKDVLILAGRELGATMRVLAEITRLDDSTVSRRFDTARQRSKGNADLQKAVARVIKKYSRP